MEYNTESAKCNPINMETVYHVTAHSAKHPKVSLEWRFIQILFSIFFISMSGYNSLSKIVQDKTFSKSARWSLSVCYSRSHLFCVERNLWSVLELSLNQRVSSTARNRIALEMDISTDLPIWFNMHLKSAESVQSNAIQLHKINDNK